MSENKDQKLINESFRTSILEYDPALMVREFKEGKPIADPVRVKDLDKKFGWMKTFVNCWTGNPNVGKSTFVLFLMLLKSKIDGWKWAIFSPEMISSRRFNGKVLVGAYELIDELVFMLTGKNPYKHLERQRGLKQMELDEYIEALDWIEAYFIFVNPKEKTSSNIRENFKFLSGEYGIDGCLLDPWKNIAVDGGDGMFTKDDILHRAFAEIKDVATLENISFNIIAHPKSVQNAKNSDGSYKLVTPQDLAGGAAWFNSMDGIYSLYRPNEHNDPNDPELWFYNLKQRMQDLTARRGVCKDIEFDINTHRYYFKNVCPIDGTNKGGQKAVSVQTGIEFSPIPKGKEDELPF